MIKKVVLDKADRIYHFPFDLEDFFPKWPQASKEKKFPLIDLGHFLWPKSTETAASSMQLASREDLLRLKEVISSWLKKEYGVTVDPSREIFIGHGIRRTMLDLCLAFVEAGDIVLCPEPGLPSYRRFVICAGGVPVSYLMSERTNYKPSFKRNRREIGQSGPHNDIE